MMRANGKASTNAVPSSTTTLSSNLKLEDAWGMEEAAQFLDPEFESVWEIPSATPSNNLYAASDFENDWEIQEANHFTDSEITGDWEDNGAYSSQEISEEARRTARKLIPYAKNLAAIAPHKLLGIKPASSEKGSRIGKQLHVLLQGGEAAAIEMESKFFSISDSEVQVGDSSTTYEAVFGEVLAAEASHTPNQAEAAALLGAVVPSAVKSMGAQQALRPVMLPLLQISNQLTQIFQQSGSAGHKLQRVLPTILRRVIASLQLAQRAGKPVNAALIKQVMAEHAARVLKNPATVTGAIARNAVIRKQVVKPGKPIA